jgi:SAM-dependent methyltransferase
VAVHVSIEQGAENRHEGNSIAGSDEQVNCELGPPSVHTSIEIGAEVLVLGHDLLRGSTEGELGGPCLHSRHFGRDRDLVAQIGRSVELPALPLPQIEQFLRLVRLPGRSHGENVASAFQRSPGRSPSRRSGTSDPTSQTLRSAGLATTRPYDRAMESFDAGGTFNEDYLYFYDPMFTAERNRLEADEIEATLGLDPGSSILDAPCGHGRIAILLSVDGFRVTGVDVTELFLDRAGLDRDRLAVDVDYRKGDLRSLPVSGPFDAVVCWFTSFGYFDDDDNRRVLDEFARVLRPGGRLLIETMHHDGFVRGFQNAPEATTMQRGGDELSDVNSFDSTTGRVETERTVRRDDDVRRSHHSVRLPTAPELDVWLAGAGFIDRAFTDRAGAPLRFDSWRLVATATKA